MIDLHKRLDKYFGKRLSLSVFFRIWLVVVLMMGVVVGMGFYTIQQTIRPSVKRVVEDTLADTSLALAQVYQPLVMAYLDDKITNLATSSFDRQSLKTPIFYDQKQHSQYHIYITDKAGKIIYDSHNLAKVGDDFGRWNDVYLTLQGKYGARSTDDGTGVSVMYVAAPIVHQGQIVGVVSTGKSIATLEPYIALSEREIGKIILQIAALGVLLTTLIAWWLRHSIHQINGYTKDLASSRRPHFYLANELNELTDNIYNMKNAIENKAYVTEYVHTLTHELKSPLTAIRASSELLNDELSADDRAMLCQMIGEQSDKMTLFIDKLLTLARLEQPDMRIHKQPLALLACIHQAKQQLDSKIRVSACQISHFVGDDVLVVADAFWLLQALINVLDNAIFYGRGQIGIDFEDNTLWVVNDSGKLPSYVACRAFERYFSHPIDMPDTTQTNKTPNHHSKQTSYKGSGLGLPLVQEIMVLHGGFASFCHFDKTSMPNLPNNLRNLLQNSPADDFVLVSLCFTL